MGQVAKVAGLCAAVLCAQAWAAPAAEPAADPNGGLKLGLSAAAVFPVSAGFQVQLQLPGRIRLLGGVGTVPQSFRGAVNDALVAMDAYQSEVGDFVLTHIDSAMTRRAGLGLRPFANSGFYLEAVYTNLQLQGGMPVSTLVSAFMSGQTATDTGAGERLVLRTTLHMVNAQAGWEWTWGRVFLRGALGAAFTVGANSDIVRVAEDGTEHDLGPFDKVVEGYLDASLRKHAHVPTASLMLGYWFF